MFCFIYTDAERFNSHNFHGTHSKKTNMYVCMCNSMIPTNTPYQSMSNILLCACVCLSVVPFVLVFCENVKCVLLRFYVSNIWHAIFSILYGMKMGTVMVYACM